MKKYLNNQIIMKYCGRNIVKEKPSKIIILEFHAFFPASAWMWRTFTTQIVKSDIFFSHN